jgi:hypothetical protein
LLADRDIRERKRHGIKLREAASIEGASENDQQQVYDRSEQREDASLRERRLAADFPRHISVRL